jgi:pSer/pThr/pTyr-binding forkhead associated (FHA) protein
MKISLWQHQKLVKEYQFDDGEYKAGRQSNSDIVLNGSENSRTHFIFTVSGKMVIIEDAGSKNGTFYQNKRIKRKKIKGREAVQAGTYNIQFNSNGNKDTANKNSIVGVFSHPLALPFVVILCSCLLVLILQGLCNSRKMQILSDKSVTELGFLITQTLNERNRSNWVENRIDKLTLEPFIDNEFVLTAGLIDYDGVILLPRKDAGKILNNEAILKSLETGKKDHVMVKGTNLFVEPILYNGIPLGASVISLSNPVKNFGEKYWLVITIFLLTVTVSSAMIGTWLIDFVSKKTFKNILDQIPSYLNNEIETVKVPDFWDRNKAIRKSLELIYHCAAVITNNSAQRNEIKKSTATDEIKRKNKLNSASLTQTKLKGKVYCTINIGKMTVDFISPEFKKLFEITRTPPEHLLQILTNKDQEFIEAVMALSNDQHTRISLNCRSRQAVCYAISGVNKLIHVIIEFDSDE